MVTDEKFETFECLKKKSNLDASEIGKALSRTLFKCL